jgi:hypothetical protein
MIESRRDDERIAIANDEHVRSNPGQRSLCEVEFVASMNWRAARRTAESHRGGFSSLQAEPDRVLLSELGDAGTRLFALAICGFLHEKLYLANTNRVIRVRYCQMLWTDDLN